VERERSGQGTSGNGTVVLARADLAGGKPRKEEERALSGKKGWASGVVVEKAELYRKTRKAMAIGTSVAEAPGKRGDDRLVSQGGKKI